MCASKAKPSTTELPAAVPTTIEREYGPFEPGGRVNGVAFDGSRVWAATGSELKAFSPATGQVEAALPAHCPAGTTFDGESLFQIADTRINKIDPKSGKVLSSIPAPGNGGDSGLAWAEGTLWVGEHRGRRIHQVDPATGKVLRTLESNRFVTGVSWTEGQLWHATWENDESELRRVDPDTGTVLERLQLPTGVGVSGLDSDRGELFFCGGGSSGKVRAVKRAKGGGR